MSAAASPRDVGRPRIDRAFKYDRNAKSHVWCRWFNESPVLILIGAVVLVVLKPF
jgi:putative membrane protein